MPSDTTRWIFPASIFVLAVFAAALSLAPDSNQARTLPPQDNARLSSAHTQDALVDARLPTDGSVSLLAAKKQGGRIKQSEFLASKAGGAEAGGGRSSNDPVESFVANADIVATQWLRDGHGHRIKHKTLRCPVSGRKFEAKENRRPSKDGGPDQIRHDLFSGEQVLVVSEDGADELSVRAKLRVLGLTVKERITDTLYTVSVPSVARASAAATIDTINASTGSGLQARPDFVGFGGAVPNDPIFADTWGGGWGQWNLRNSGSNSSVRSNPVAGADVAATSLWDVVQSSAGVTIAVLDSGVRTNHPDFAGISWRGTNIISTNANFSDDNGHGTGVVGIMAANRDNSTGIAGLIGPADYLVVRVLQNSISNTAVGTTSDLIKGLAYARSNGAKVINMSVQGFPNDPDLRNEINACAAADILLVVCAGNNGSNNDATPNFPSSFTNANIISVGSHDWTDARWNGGTGMTNFPSNFGAASVDVFAPGANIPAPDLSRSYGDYSWWTGTSFAAPHVTAAAAMVKALNPSWTALQVKQAVLSSVTTNANYTSICVSGGRLNALGAVGRAVMGRPTNDNDLDGFGNLIEYLAGTRADSQGSQPVITAGRDSDSFSLTMPRAVRPYARLLGQQSTSLQVWTTNGVTNSGTDSIFRASIPNGNTAGFLRVIAVPVP